MKPYLLIFLACVTTVLSAQDKNLPYYEIPNEPATYSAGAVAARMIDGLGFRYYWATDGLRPEDLQFEPNKDSRTVAETIQHIYDLSSIIVNATSNTPNELGATKPTMNFAEMRQQTLKNLKAASDRLAKATDKDMNDFKLIFKNENGTREASFWYNLNGPIADALWHVGQVVSFRRTSGNPFSEKVNVFTGKVSQ
jgi:hypothetical protein